MGFKDRTFCSSDCIETGCWRFFSDKLHEEAVEWWGSEDYPIATADFSTRCEAYKSGEETAYE